MMRKMTHRMYVTRGYSTTDGVLKKMGSVSNSPMVIMMVFKRA